MDEPAEEDQQKEGLQPQHYRNRIREGLAHCDRIRNGCIEKDPVGDEEPKDGEDEQEAFLTSGERSHGLMSEIMPVARSAHLLGGGIFRLLPSDFP